MVIIMVRSVLSFHIIIAPTFSYHDIACMGGWMYTAGHNISLKYTLLVDQNDGNVMTCLRTPNAILIGNTLLVT